MNNKYEKIWDLALPYLKKGIRKDFVTHTRGVVTAMEMLLAKESGDPSVLIPAAMLHDVGWAKVAPWQQKNWQNVQERIQGERQHLAYAPEIIREILFKAGCGGYLIEQVIDIVLAHKFQNPKQHDKQLLIDADNLSDILKEPFYADIKAYDVSPWQHLAFRKKNTFYTSTAAELFKQEYIAREREITEDTGKIYYA